MSRKGMLIALVVLLALLASCAPRTAPAAPAAPQAAAPQAPAQAAPVPVKPAVEDKWEKLVAAAKAEGTVVSYMAGGAALRAALVQTFKERFGIRLEIIAGKGSALSEKVLSERRAKLYLVDVMTGGSTNFINELKPGGALDPLEKELILPEVLDPKNWMPGEPSWPDKDRLMVAISSDASGKLGLNTNLVKPGEIKSLKDLLNPKWKGKIIINDPTIAGTGGKFFGVVAEKYGYDIWRQIAQQEPVVLRDERLMVDWLVHGKYAIIISPKTEPMFNAKDAGAPVDTINVEEGNYKSGDLVGLMNRAPHPNAARVYINWLLTHDGQTVYNAAQGTWSGRADVTVEGTAAKKKIPGAQYFDSNAEEFIVKQPDHFKVAAEIFAAAIKK